MKIVGKRRERQPVEHAQADLLREGARFNDEMHQLAGGLRFPKGIWRYASQAEADRHWQACVVANLVAMQESERDDD